MSYGTHIIHFLREHKTVLISAIVTAVIVFSPSFLFPLMADSYKGINVGNFGVDEFHYLSMGKELLEGHALGNLFLREGKDHLSPEQKYTPYLVLPIKWLGLSEKITIVTISTVYGFIGVFLLVLLIYFFALQLSQDRRLSLVTALFVVLGYNLLTNYLPFYYFNLYSRPLIPLTGVLGFFLYLNLLLKSLQSSKRSYCVWAGIAFGLSFYTYFYTWTFISVVSGILASFYFFVKRETVQCKKILLITAIGFLLGSVELFLLFSFSNTDMGRQILLYGGGSLTHVFTIVKMSWLALVSFLLYWYWHPEELHWPLMLALILSGIVAINQGVITGREFQRFHYFWYFIIPTVTVIGLYMVWKIVQSTVLKRLFFYFMLIALFVNGTVQAYTGTLTALPIKNHMQYYQPIIEYLKQKEKPAVILASNQFFAGLFTTYTNHDLFWQHQALVYNTSIKALHDALYVYLYLNRDSRNNFLRFVQDSTTPNNDYKDMYFSLRRYYTDASSPGKERLTEEDFDKRIAAEYLAVTQKPDGIKDILKARAVAYIVWDKDKNPEWDLSGVSGLTELVSNRGIYLYSIAYGN